MIKSLSYRPEHVSKNANGKAWLGHIPFAHWLVGAVKPRTFVELGTHEGASYFSFCDSVLENGLTTFCHAVDSWQGDAQAGMYGEDVFNFVKKINSDRYQRFSKLHKCMFDEALDKFDDGAIDLLHIDGFHSYEAVTHDFETWMPKLASDAVVLFHDTRVFKPDFGVHKLWAELNNQHPHQCFEFFHSFGLGVFCTGATGNIFEKFGPKEIDEGSVDFLKLLVMRSPHKMKHQKRKLSPQMRLCIWCSSYQLNRILTGALFAIWFRRRLYCWVKLFILRVLKPQYFLF